MDIFFTGIPIVISTQLSSHNLNIFLSFMESLWNPHPYYKVNSIVFTSKI